MAEATKLDCNTKPIRGRKQLSCCYCQTNATIKVKLAVKIDDMYNSMPGLCRVCIKTLAFEKSRE
jgi:hypothetical protein